MAIRISNPAIQHFDKGTGAQLAGGLLFFFEPNGSSTPKATFIDAEESQENSNPVVLDGNGFEPNIFGNGSYRIVLTTPIVAPLLVGVQQWERDPVVFGGEEGAFSEWVGSTSYVVNDIVEASDGRFYIAILNNSASDPNGGANANNWSQFDLLNRYNFNESYEIDSVVRGSDGIIYTAVQASSFVNQHDPVTDTPAAFWKMFDNIRIDGNSITATNTNGNINIDPNGTGDLLTDGEAIGLSQITQQRFTSTGQGPWIKPANVKFIILEMIGGGAGGGQSGNVANRGGGGGGAGGYVREILDVTSIVSSNLLIGSGGAPGSSGTNTTFTISSAVAGNGFPGVAGNLLGVGGDGGIPTGGNSSAILITGGDGHAGSATIVHSGNGGGGYFGSGGKGRNNTASGDPGVAKGSGGGGGATTITTVTNGGPGAFGIIIVTEYR